MSDVSSNPLQLREQTEMKPLIDGCVKEALLSYCKGTPAKIPWPHRVLHEAVRRIEDLESDLAAAVAASEINYSNWMKAVDSIDHYGTVIHQLQAELAMAREVLIGIWARHPNFPLNGKTPREQAEAHYAREVAHAPKGEEG